ncbi:PsbP domain-containing protein [Fagus crenata]
MPQDRVVHLEWDRRCLSVLGVENNRLYELRLQKPENVFLEEENDLRQVMNFFRVNQVNIKSYANNNELAVLPQDHVVRLEWDRHYLSVLGVENNQLYELRLQTPENVFLEEENDLHQVMDSFRVNKVLG